MNDKPIIRHCRNCEYSAKVDECGMIHCAVKYKYYSREEQRAAAIFCRHYKRKTPKPEFLNKRVNLPTKQKTVEEDRE